MPALALGLLSLPILAVDGLSAVPDRGRAVVMFPGEDGAGALARVIAAGALPLAPGRLPSTWLVQGDKAALDRLRQDGSLLLNDGLIRGCLTTDEARRDG